MAGGETRSGAAIQERHGACGESVRELGGGGTNAAVLTALLRALLAGLTDEASVLPPLQIAVA